MKKQEAPFTIKIELTEGCCLSCSFCGIKGIRKSIGGYKFMTVSMAKIIAEQIAESQWNSKIEFTMRGEPTANPNCNKIISVFRKALPRTQLMMTSNGKPLLDGYGAKGKISTLFKAGLNILALDDYKIGGIIPKILKSIPKMDKLYYPRDDNSSPHQRRDINEHVLIIISDISGGKIGNRVLNNQCGSAAPLDAGMINARCARPFRELVIRWDGKVPLCCNDWRGIYCCGDVLDRPSGNKDLEKIWNNERFVAVRKKVYHRQRDFKPCKGCNSKSFRVGLLPDKMGKEDMGKPNKKTKKIIDIVLSEKQLTKSVLRKWER